MLSKKILFISLVINFLLGGCMSSEKKNLEGLFPYKSVEYERKTKDAKVKLEDTNKILCKFIKNKKELHEFVNMYFIYQDSYVFTLQKNQVKTTYKNGGYIAKGIYGLYINMHTGKLTLIKKNNSNKDVLIVLEKDSKGMFGKFKHYSIDCNKK